VKQDYAEAVRWFRKAAEQGHAGAQSNLGVMYKNGQGVKRDHAEAVRWFRKAAEQGQAKAHYNLGVMYANGQGVKQDYAEAVRWLRKAAEQGDAHAQYNLGVMYENGQGVKRDHAEAVRWYRKAAEQGVVNAVSALNRLSAGAVTSNASSSTPKATAPATVRVCSNCGIGDQATARASATSEFIGPRCGRGSLTKQTAVRAICNLELQNHI